ncbi:hypothetical protein Agub_g6670 [Astrephomene gubernaculifera]|uniref:RRM domain-containing protein n=1 Tax=Astrephomene gubernaculifera TaxID=47775 RepID=A0AAD3DNW8_9CHLO|nr:hypothetical protein Agub_g6670 [Astrephomene gubernaculifera]
MPGDPALEQSGAIGSKRRRLSADDGDGPAAKKSYSDAEIAAELAHGLHIKEQRRAEVRALYLNYGTLLKGSETASEALAFQGLLQCGNGSLGVRRLAARLVPRFLPRFPSHTEQAFHLLTTLYDSGSNIHDIHESGTDAGDSHSRRHHSNQHSPVLPNGNEAIGTDAVVARLNTTTDGTTGATGESALREAMRRDALLGLGNVLEAAVRQPERNVPVVSELVLYLMRQLRLLCSGGGVDGPVAVQPHADANGGAPLAAADGTGVELKAEPAADGGGGKQHPHPHQTERSSRECVHRAGGGVGDADVGCCHPGTTASSVALTAAAAADSDSDVGIMRSLLFRAFCLFPRIVLAACLQPFRQQAAAAPASNTSSSSQQRVKPPQQQRDCQAAELLLALLLLKRAVPLGPPSHGWVGAVGTAAEVAVKDAESGKGRIGGPDSPPLPPPRKCGLDAAAAAMMTAAGDTAGGGSAGAGGSAAQGCCLAEQVLSQVPDTQSWLRQLMNAMNKGKSASSLPSELRAHLDALLRFCTTPATTTTAAAPHLHLPGSAAAATAGKTSPKSCASPGVVVGAPGAAAAAATTPAAAGVGADGTSGLQPTPGPGRQPSFARAVDTAAAAAGTAVAAAPPAGAPTTTTSTHSLVGSEDGSRSVPMDLDQSVCTTVGRHDHVGPSGGVACGGLGDVPMAAAAAAAAAAGGAVSYASGPADTAATPAPPPPPLPPPPPHQHGLVHPAYGGQQEAAAAGLVLPPPPPVPYTQLPPPPPPPAGSAAAAGTGAVAAGAVGTSASLRGGLVCRAEACLYIAGLPAGLTEAALVSELGRSGHVESVHPCHPQPPTATAAGHHPLLSHHHPTHGSPATALGDDVYVVFVSLRDAAMCYEAVARTSPFGGSRPLLVEFCSAFPADSPAARRRAAASQFVWLSATVGSAATPESVVAALQESALPVPQQILKVQGRAPGMLLCMASGAVVPQVTACLSARFAPPPPVAASAAAATPGPSQPPLPYGTPGGVAPPPPPVTAAAAVAASCGAPYSATPGAVGMPPAGGGSSTAAVSAATGDAPPANCRTLWFGQLHEAVRDEELLSACRTHGGELTGYRFLRGSHCAFVDFATQTAAEAAKRAMHGMRLGPQHIRVEWKLQDSGPPSRAPPMSRNPAGAAGSTTPPLPGGGAAAATAAAPTPGAAAGSLPLPPPPHGAPAAAASTQPPTPPPLLGSAAAQQQQQLTPQALAAASVAAAAAAVAARGAAGFSSGQRTGADRWAPAVIPPPAAAATTPAATPHPPLPPAGYGTSHANAAAAASAAAAATSGRSTPTPMQHAGGMLAAGVAGLTPGGPQQQQFGFVHAPHAATPGGVPLPPNPHLQTPQLQTGAYPGPPMHHHPTAAHPNGPGTALQQQQQQPGATFPHMHVHSAQHPPGEWPLPPPPPPSVGAAPHAVVAPGGIPMIAAAGGGGGGQAPPLQRYGSGHPMTSANLTTATSLPTASPPLPPSDGGVLPPPPPLQPPPHPHPYPHATNQAGHVSTPPHLGTSPGFHSPGVAPSGPYPHQQQQQPHGHPHAPHPHPHAPHMLVQQQQQQQQVQPPGHHHHHHHPQHHHQSHPQHQQQQHPHPQQQQPPGPQQQQSAGGAPAVTWQGGLAKSGSHMCTLLCTSGGASAASGASPGEREPVTWPTTLDVKLRVDLTYVVHTLYNHTAPHARAMRRLVPAGGSDQRSKLSEFLSYLAEKNRAGVIKLDAAAGLPPRTLYLVPPSEQVCSVLGAEWTPRDPFLLALVVPTAGGGGSAGGAR